MQATALEGGFKDAPIEAARAFRAAMRVMARPGSIETLDVACPPGPISAAAGSLILTLCDHETGLYLAPDYDTPDIRAWVAFHTGASVVSADQAQFAIGTWEGLQPLAQFQIGTPEYPDRSATLIVEVDRLQQAGAHLRGPGIRETAQMRLPDPEAMRQNAALFPLGLDFYFTHEAQVAALPRSTQVEGPSCM